MELMISGDFANRILSLLKKDKRLATSLAGEWLARVDNTSIAQYLLTRDIAVELLAARLVSSPERTVKELQALAAGDAVEAAPAPQRAAKTTKKAPAKKAAKKATKKAPTKKATKKAAKKAPAKNAGRPGIQRRTRLPRAQIATLKDEVVSYLGSVDSASRKQIIEAAGIPTPAIYNRIVGELREEGLVGSQGQKAKAVYFLEKSKRKAKGKKRR